MFPLFSEEPVPVSGLSFLLNISARIRGEIAFRGVSVVGILGISNGALIFGRYLLTAVRSILRVLTVIEIASELFFKLVGQKKLVK